MNAKIRTKQRHMNKVLDVISTYGKARNGDVYIDKSFYNALLPLNETQINQALNALEWEGVIEIFPRTQNVRHPRVNLTSFAFAYRKQIKQSSFRFWLPTIISIFALIVAIIAVVVSIFAYLK